MDVARRKCTELTKKEPQARNALMVPWLCQVDIKTPFTVTVTVIITEALKVDT
jgi:hypothetical protein